VSEVGIAADLLSEVPVGLAELAREEGVSPATVGRWARGGVRGIRLESYLRGGRRVSSREAVRRFYAATSAGGDRPPGASRKRRDAIDRAEDDLRDLGL
jgi:Protein of unknown function (DUF1580)